MNKINNLHIWIYREVYSLYHKEMINKNFAPDQIKSIITNILQEDYLGHLTFKEYAKMNVIDAGQRVLRIAKKLNRTIETLPPIPKESLLFPDLRCPQRSKDQDDPELFYPIETPNQFLTQ
jgi:hypothetical protein